MLFSQADISANISLLQIYRPICWKEIPKLGLSLFKNSVTIKLFFTLCNVSLSQRDLWLSEAIPIHVTVYGTVMTEDRKSSQLSSMFLAESNFFCACYNNIFHIVQTKNIELIGLIWGSYPFNISGCIRPWYYY